MISIIKKKIDLVIDTHDKAKIKLEALKISLIYLVLGIGWSIFSYRITIKHIDAELVLEVNKYKEWFFVLISALVIYYLISIVLRKIYLADKDLLKSYEDLSAVHEELTATEEELRTQFEELIYTTSMLGENERRLKKAQEIASVGNWEYDVKTKKLWASDEAHRLFWSNSPDGYVSTDYVYMVFDEENRDKLFEGISVLIEDKLNYNVQYKINNLQGTEERYMDSRAEIKCDKNGLPIMILGVVRDITERKQYELMLENRNVELGALYEQVAASEEELRAQFEELSKVSARLSESEGELKKAQTIASVGNWSYDIRDGRLWASDETHRLFWSNSPDGFVSINYIYNCFDEEYRFKLNEGIKFLIEGNGSYNVEYKINNHEGTEKRYINTTAEVEFDRQGNAVRILGVVKDITKSKQYELELKNSNEELAALYEQLAASEEELKQQLDEIFLNRDLLQLSEERYRILVDNSQDIIFSCDSYGIFIAVNQRFLSISNKKSSDIIGRKMNDVSSNEELNLRWEDAVEQVINTKEVYNLENTYYKDRIFDVIVSPVFDIHNQVVGVTATNHDVTERKKNEEIITHMAYYDNLTNLPNRVLFIDTLNNSIEKARKANKKLVVLFIDMDNFKRVNDTLGHAHGDEFLRECSNRLKSCMRHSDIIARISGDEFSVMLDGIEELSEALPIIESLLAVFKEPFYIGNSLINMTASLGIAVFPRDGERAEDLIRSADTAMYKAKEMGKNGYQFFDVEMKNDLMRKLNIEVLLRRAIGNNELILHYQPQFHAGTKKLRGFEALIRWDNPELGFMNPLEFIPTAEETGLITIMGEWVLNTACEFNSRVNEKYNCDTIENR